MRWAEQPARSARPSSKPSLTRLGAARRSTTSTPASPWTSSWPSAPRRRLHFFHSKGVWRVVPRAHAAGRRVVGTRWVSCNKGDAEHPEIRCRLVCQEVKTYQSEEFYAATPTGETLKLILSFAAEDADLEVSLVDLALIHI